MGYWDTFTSNLFGSDTKGRRTYSPLGKLGESYLVPDDRAELITRSTRRAYQIMLAAIIVTQLLMGWRWSLFIGLLVLVWFFVNSLRQVSGLEVVSAGEIAKGSKVENLQRAAKATGTRTLVTLLTGSLLLVVTGIWAVIVSRKSEAWLAIVFFGVCSLVFAAQIYLNKRRK